MSIIGKIVINLRETSKKTKFTPPSLIKATTKVVTSDKKDLSLTSVSNGDDIMMTSSTQNKSKKANNSTHIKGNPPEAEMGKSSTHEFELRI